MSYNTWIEICKRSSKFNKNKIKFFMYYCPHWFISYNKDIVLTEEFLKEYFDEYRVLIFKKYHESLDDERLRICMKTNPSLSERILDPDIYNSLLD